jgi:hypothetical protein
LRQNGHNTVATLTRITLIINFFLLLALIGPLGRSRSLYIAERRAGIAAPITLALQVWFVGSTLFVSGLFLWRLLRRSDTAVHKRLRPTMLDWTLFLAWWIVLIAACLFAFVTGMGG